MLSESSIYSISAIDIVNLFKPKEYFYVYNIIAWTNSGLIHSAGISEQKMKKDIYLCQVVKSVSNTIGVHIIIISI